MYHTSLVVKKATGDSGTNTGVKLFKFSYSPYARKVQAILDLAGLGYDAVEVPYGDRRELVSVTGGYLQVPVLVDDAAKVWTDSRTICEQLLRGETAALLTPAPLEGPIWAYADFCDGPLEDILFRIATPLLVAKKIDARRTRTVRLHQRTQVRPRVCRALAWRTRPAHGARTTAAGAHASNAESNPVLVRQQPNLG